jgi:ribosomal protein S18 acetylase RimI-like enzyme
MIEIDIAPVDTVTDELQAGFERLVSQLTINHPSPTREELSEMINSETSSTLIARIRDTDRTIVGTLTLITYRVPTGIRARIEDVIVDEPFRKQGIGKALVLSALKMAQNAGAEGVALTSNPQRTEANNLYQRMGFKRWETNLYFYKFENKQ